MINPRKQKALAKLLSHWLAVSLTVPAAPLMVTPARAMDTDIFTAQSTPGATPNVLIVLDNTSNWARQNQHWPGGIQQGQAEVDAIKTVIQNLPGSINVGLLEFVTGGPATDNGGYVRFPIAPMGQAQGTTATSNKTAFSNTLTTIFNNINTPNEKQNSNQPYGNLMYDVYNYFAGLAPYAASADVVSSLPTTATMSGGSTTNGYTANFTRFRSPLSSDTSCANNYIIFIGNPNASGPASDATANTTALSNVGGSTSELPLPQYTQTMQAISSNLGYSTACYTTPPTGTPTDYASQCPPASSTYDTCSFSSTDTNTSLPTCSSGTTRYSVIATTPTTTVNPNIGTTSACYTSAPSTFPDFSVCSQAGNSCSANTPGVSTSASCPSGTQRYMVQDVVTATGANQTQTALTTACYQNTNSWNSSDHGTLTCPAASGNTTYSCTYSVGNPSSSTGCASGKHFTVTQTATPTTTTTTNKGYTLACSASSASATTTGYTCTGTCQINSGNTSNAALACPSGSLAYTVKETTTTGSSVTTLGNTFACYSSIGSCSTSDYTCPSGATCSCSATGATTGGTCPAGARYQVLGNVNATVDTPTGTFGTDTQQLNADEWARFLHQIGVPVGSAKQTVATYTIDVYNAQPNAQQSGLLASMARAGGGKYFSAMNENQIVADLQSIFAEIQAVNTTFASASLPIAASNRAQNDNQVYIGMFRPDPTDHPRWFGNLKRYQVGSQNGFTILADVNGNQADSSTTGFITPCAVSWWTADSGNFWYDTTNNQSRIFITQATSPGTAWQSTGDDTDFAKGLCGSTGIWSDSPDGATVEKGGAAEMLRQQASRTIKTLDSGNNLMDFTSGNVTISGNSTVNTNIVNFIRGQDVTGEIAGSASTGARPSIHGDVVHSRPLPIDYGGTTGVVVYYGANDGTYRAVDASTGKEKWAFIAPETFSSLERLLDNSPLVQTPSPTPPGGTAISGATPKPFFFDGSTGLYQNADSSKVWIFPSMRRGGRMLYAFDVSTPSTPQFKWKVGCPDLTDDNGCTSGMSGIGQTWSIPNVAFLNGFSMSTPVVIVGGGYDTCEDGDSATPVCSSPKGAAVYVLNANTGALIKSFSTDRSVAADVALVDINLDGKVDAAYVADTGGNIYRIDFSDKSNSFAPVDSSQWSITKVAYTNGSSRKFLFPPALLPYQGKVYVAIGSGDREHPLAASYPYTTPVTNRFYVYLDDPSRSGATNLDGSNMFNYTDESSDTCSTPGVFPNGATYGWYMNLTAGTGEQVVTSALVGGGLANFSTNRPLVSDTSCTSSLGEASNYWVNLFNGSGAIGVTGVCGGKRRGILVGGGLPPSPVLGTVNVGGIIQLIVIGAVSRNNSGGGGGSQGGGSSGGTTTGAPTTPTTPFTMTGSKRNRIYWRTNSDTH